MDVFTPTNEAESAAIVADACAAKRTLSIEGNGSKRGLGRLSEASAILKLAGLRGVVAYEPDELVITVRAGTPLAEVERLLAEKNQCLAFEPGSWSFDPAAEATIGGTVAAGVAGSRRVVMGGARDHLIGFRAINGEGQLFKAGGKVVKNVTGYDLPKIAAGSFGTLFAMTEVTLRTYPRTAMPTSLVVRDLDFESGCALLRKAAGSPFEAAGFCYLPRTALGNLELPFDAASLTVIRIEGSEESMAARAQACAAAVAPTATLVRDDVSRRLWAGLLELKPFSASPTMWRLSVPPNAAVSAVAALRPERFVVDWAGGLLWIEPGSAVASGDAIHDIARRYGGHAMLFRGSDEMRRTAPVFAPRDEVTLALTRRLKAAFDPAGVFNPARMYAGI